MKQKLEFSFLTKNGLNNMFNQQHYVPILKWKRAEQGALESLDSKNKQYITPLIQLVMPKQKPEDNFEALVEKFKKQLNKIPDNIIKVWGKEPIFVDFSLLFTTELKIESINTILTAGKTIGAVFIPVIHLSDEEEIKNTMCSLAKKSGNGICLRLICPDFFDISNPIKLNSDISEFLLKYGLNPESVDLLIDIKEIGNDASKYDRYFEASQNIYDLPRWRTYTFAGGSFPEDLSSCKLDDENPIPRIEWNKLQEKNANETLIRKPTFSDYTIQYPIYREVSQFFHPTTSIKYTQNDHWLIMKGKKQKFELYLANAAILINDKRFLGENYSEGDKYISEKAKHFPEYMKEKKNGQDIKGTGSTESWLKAGINHHLTLVANQVASLL